MTEGSQFSFTPPAPVFKCHPVRQGPGLDFALGNVISPFSAVVLIQTQRYVEQVRCELNHLRRSAESLEKRSLVQANSKHSHPPVC